MRAVWCRFHMNAVKAKVIPTSRKSYKINVVWIIDFCKLFVTVTLYGVLWFFLKDYREIHIRSHCKSFHHNTRSTWLWRQQANFSFCSHCIPTRRGTGIRAGTTRFNEIVWWDKIFFWIEIQPIGLRWPHRFGLTTWPENNIIQEI